MASPLGAFLCPPGFSAPRGLRALSRESSVVLETVRHTARSAAFVRSRGVVPHARRDVAVQPDPVVLVPGFMAGDVTLSLMRRHLRGAGHRIYRSAIHANIGCPSDAVTALERRVEAIALRREQRVTVVGHSLGGLLARAVAARRPDLVDGIVTLGSPLLAPGAVHSVLLLDLAVLVTLRRVGLGAVMGSDCTSGDCARSSWEQSMAPLAPSVRYTSIYSRRDGIVDWKSCLDPAADLLEVTSSHVGMAVDPLVLDVVQGVLPTRARPPGAVTPARSPAARLSSAG